MPVCCETINNGLYAASLESQRVNYIVSGKDYDNDFQGYYHGIYLAQGRISGYGS